MKRKMLQAYNACAIILLLCAISQSTVAQTNTIRGRVSGTQNEPLANVSVHEKGTTNGTLTKEDGSFTLSVKDTSALIEFSFLGYASQEVSAGSAPFLNIQLQSKANDLNSVVIIGYQSVRRKDLTGATGVVDMTAVNRVTSASVGESIQGLVPGVTVRNTGAPGTNAAVEIRGVSNFGNSNPLYVIDGMFADANVTVNPDDIASIQVLKDASAAAIYGSRAGNGVIIITTKRGREGPTRLNLSARYGIQQIPKRWDMMDAAQYLQTVKQQYQNSGLGLPGGLNNNTINTDWQDAIFRTGNSQDYYLSASGGAASGNYFISGGYYKNTGVLIGNSFERASLRINTEAKKGRLTVGENLMLSTSYGANPGGRINAFYEVPQMLPVIAVQAENYKSIQYNPGGWGMGTTDIPTYANNYAAVNALDKIRNSFVKVLGNVYLEFKLTDWLIYRFSTGVEASFDHNREVRDTGIWRYTNQPAATSINENRSQFTNFLMEHTLNFNKTFGRHSVNGVFGFSRTQQRTEFTSGGRTGLQTVNGTLFTTIGSALGAPAAGGGTSLLWRAHGYLGRINYAYDDRYLLTLTGRIDQDSRFGPDYRTGYFPSVAAAWRINRESFFHVPVVSDLKLRASYGKLGFSDVLGSWDYLGVLNNNPRAIYGTGQAPAVGQYQAALVNEDLHWETRIQQNIGIDAGFWDNRLSLSLDVYNSKSKDVLVQLPIANYLGGVGSPSINAASIRNRGIEFTATYRSKTAPFHWDISGNITTIKNRILSVGNQNSGADYLEPANFLRSQVGHAIGEWYVIKTAGIFRSAAEVNAYTDKNGKLIQPDAKPGDVKYIDTNGDGVINNDDRQFLGSPWPSVQAGLQFNAFYNNFTLNLQWVGVFGNKLYNDVRRVLDSYQLTNFRKDIDPWSENNPGGTDPRLAVSTGSDPAIAANNMAQTDRWLEKGTYLRLRNIELAYNVSKGILSRAGLSNARIFISGQNLFTITSYKGLDPDVQGNGILQRGFDNGNWPASRFYTAGITCEF